MGKLTLAERETIINYNQEGKRANVYTCDPVLIRKLDKIIIAGNAGIELESEDIYSKSYTVPKKWVKIRPPKVLSEKQLEVLKKLHEKH